MSFDAPTRNRLAKLVGDVRTLLTDEFFEQCRSVFGIAPSGEIAGMEHLGDLDDAERATAMLLRERVDYLVRTHPDEKGGAPQAVTQVVREQAFTVLNRLAALRMAEKRGLITESVGKGYQSKGFKVFETVAGTGLGDTYHRYRQYLHCLFDELAVDLGVLFDRRSPHGVLFPRESALLECLTLVNAADVEALWTEDETIGWVYQYYNDPAERKKMRDESAAPRNSRELAVRNQFFTPRYVVEFLTDNTLGRIWYEMTRGQTRLKDQCRYLVRRPDEVFREPDAAASALPKETSVDQEGMLQRPPEVAYRPVKDPREIRMLDPACGSMHFGLYAFNLFETIYEEAWVLANTTDGSAASSVLFGPFLSFVRQYSDKAVFLAEVPRLIIEHNLHGIDIDQRAAQIAGLSLWLRAQRTWQQQGIPAESRPRILRSNIVCAEPMPGDEALLADFVDARRDTPEWKLLGQLVRRVFEAMKLAGEAGSLLKIEHEIAGALAEAKQKWLVEPKPEQARLFVDTRHPVQQELHLDVTGIADETFWESAEENIYAALQVYAEQAEHGGAYRRRLFADDAARGFAFIHLCRKRYDVVLMNPPFGEVSLGAREYLYDRLPESSRDIFAAFVNVCVQRLVPSGQLGAITNRLAFFNEFLDSWRESLFMGESASLRLAADLGYGVLDAVVETAAYVCAKTRSTHALFLNALSDVDKATSIKEGVLALLEGRSVARVHERDVRMFSRLPGNRFAYMLAPSWLAILNVRKQHNLFVGKGGICTGDDFRFYRCFWEIDKRDGSRASWRWLAKGGEFSRYMTNTHLVVDWNNEPFLLRTKNSDRYGEPGATYTYRTTSNLSARVLNEGVCFSQGGPGIVVHDRTLASFVLAYMNSFVATYCLENMVGGGDFSVKGTAARNLEPRYLEHLPRVELAAGEKEWFDNRVAELIRLLEVTDDDEAHPLFRSPRIASDLTLHDNKVIENRATFESLEKAYGIVASCEQRIMQMLGLNDADVAIAYSDSGWPFPQGSDGTEIPSELLSKLESVPRNEPKLRIASENIEYRFQNKLSHYVHADVEAIAHKYRVSPKAVCALAKDLRVPTSASLKRFVENLISYAVGVAFGRWDVRFVTGQKKMASPLLDPFGVLPTWPPGQLLSEEGLPLTKAQAATLEAAKRWNYPIDLPWDGILADEPGQLPDLEGRVHQVLQLIWSDRWEAIEREACEILNVASLREYFRTPGGFFADHLSRYSKSRRQAPIYWPLSSPKSSYTLWIYYHRLTDQTLHTALVDFVDPKIRATERALADARGGNRSKEADERADLLSELQEFRADLERVIRLPWKPDLNDGVLITASPLWKLFRLPKWQRDLKTCWEELASGDYEWAHLALSIWPERVKVVCTKDRSVAVAHDLESLFKGPAVLRKRRRSKQKSLAAGSTAG